MLDTMMMSGIGEFFSGAKSVDSYWPTSDTFGEFAYRCELTNYGEDPVFAISLSFKVDELETLKDAQGIVRSEGSKVTASRTHQAEVPNLESHGGKFVFYVYNTLAKFVKVTGPEFVTLTSAKKPDRIQVRLKQPSANGLPPMNLVPRRSDNSLQN